MQSTTVSKGLFSSIYHNVCGNSSAKESKSKKTATKVQQPVTQALHTSGNSSIKEGTKPRAISNAHRMTKKEFESIKADQLNYRKKANENLQFIVNVFEFEEKYYFRCLDLNDQLHREIYTEALKISEIASHCIGKFLELSDLLSLMRRTEEWRATIVPLRASLINSYFTKEKEVLCDYLQPSESSFDAKLCNTICWFIKESAFFLDNRNGADEQRENILYSNYEVFMDGHIKGREKILARAIKI